MKCKLSNFSFFPEERIEISSLGLENYISTENMVSNKGGIVMSQGLPKTSFVKSFKKGDVLVSSIRVYFKKIWHATRNGGCSNDVLVFRPKNNCDSNYLYYVLSSDDFFAYASKTSKGTKMPRCDKEAVMNYETDFHDLKTQQSIGSFLSQIDSLITTNNKLNDNLSDLICA